MRTPTGESLEVGTGPADLMLVRRALAGERPAIEELLVRLSCVVRFTLRLNRGLGYGLPTEVLEDVVQQVYVAVWPRLERFVGTASLESWVFGFCRNCLRAEARRRAGRLRLLKPLTDEEAEPLEQCDPGRGFWDRERADGLRSELERLSADERVVVELRHLEDWSFERIAQHLDLPASTVKDRCYRALSKMKERMRRRDVGA
jgi:RNA polymerase sigma-70 factor (ECF subfamily)